MAKQPRSWLMKSEPNAFSIEDLQRAPGQTTCWDAVVGIAKVVRKTYPDHTAFDPKDKHFDPKSNPANPTWDMVDIRQITSAPRDT